MELTSGLMRNKPAYEINKYRFGTSKKNISSTSSHCLDNNHLGKLVCADRELVVERYSYQLEALFNRICVTIVAVRRLNSKIGSC